MTEGNRVQLPAGHSHWLNYTSICIRLLLSRGIPAQLPVVRDGRKWTEAGADLCREIVEASKLGLTEQSVDGNKLVPQKAAAGATGDARSAMSRGGSAAATRMGGGRGRWRRRRVRGPSPPKP
jgi:hypothetical protein